MIWDIDISEAVKSETEAILNKDEFACRIEIINQKIMNLETEIDSLKYERDKIKKERPPVVIKWRSSIKWCLEIDSKNWRYFLKSTPAVYKCIAYKYKVEITSDIKNKIAVTLSALYKEKAIGRFNYNGTFLYGLTELFNEDLTDLKEEHKIGLNNLIIL